MKIFGKNAFGTLTEDLVTVPSGSQSSLSVDASISGQARLTGVVSLTFTQPTTAQIFYNITRGERKSLTNGKQILVTNLQLPGASPTNTVEFNFPYTVTDTTEEKECTRYTITVYNESTLFGDSKQGVSIDIDYFTLNVVAHPLEKVCFPLQVWSNKRDTPTSIPALTIPAQNSLALNLYMATNGGEVKLDFAFAFANFSEQAIQPILLWNLLRDGKSITHGSQFLLRFFDVIAPTPEVPRQEIPGGLSLVDKDVPAGSHTYQLVLTNRSLAADQKTSTFIELDVINFNLTAPSRQLQPWTNQLVTKQLFTPLGVPAVLLPPAATLLLHLRVPRNALQVKMTVALSLLATSKTNHFLYDFLRNGEPISEFNGPQLMADPFQFGRNFFYTYSDLVGCRNPQTCTGDKEEKALTPKQWVYSFSLTNRTDVPLRIDNYSFNALVVAEGKILTQNLWMPNLCG